MSYTLVVFDFDGTLADSFPWFVRALDTAADRYGFRRVCEHEIDTLRTYDGRQMMELLGVPWWKLPFVAMHLRRAMEQDITQVRLFDGIDDVLRRLAEQRIAVAVVSSNSERNVRKVLGPKNEGRVRYYECGASMFGKAARFRAILRQSGVQPKNALCIGDEVRDADSAAEAGIAFGAVGWGYNTLEALQRCGPAEVFVGVPEILEVVGE